MVFISDMSSIFNVCRILGATVLVAVKNDIKARKFQDIIFILFSMILHSICLVILHIYVLYRQENLKSTLILFTRVFLFYLSLFADASLTTLWNWKIRSVLSQLQSFDQATKFRDSLKRKTVRIVCRVIVVFNFLYWTVAGYMTYRVEPRVPVFRGILYFAMSISVNMQILIFICILFLIGKRFRHLCDMVTFSKENKLIVTDRSNGHFTLQQIWWLHCSLVNATETINSVYAIQLLLWILSISVDVLSRIYSLNVHELSVYGKIREAMLAINYTCNLVLITTACHLTAHQANRVGELIFSPYSSVSMKRIFLQENLEAAAYFQLRKVHFFTIAGFIRVDLPLLVTVFSTLITYIVILT